MNALIKRLARTWIVVAAFGLLSGCITPRWDWPPWEVNPAPEQPQPEDPDPEPEPDNPLDLPAGTQWRFGTDISGWPETMQLTNARLVYRGINSKGDPAWRVFDLQYTRLQDIPRYFVMGDPNNVHNVNGSLWFVRQFRGQWYIGTIDYLRVNQRQKDFAINPGWLLDPKPGDRVGFMVSTMNRSYDGTIVQGDPNSPYRERSNIFWMTWP